MSERKSLTQSEKAVYGALVRFKSQNQGNSPSIREIKGPDTSKSISALVYTLNRLEAKGWIRRSSDGKARRIEVVGAVWTAPDVGEAWATTAPHNQGVDAGRHRPAVEDISDRKCKVCKRPYAKLRCGKCMACYKYFSIHGRNRPQRLIDRQAPLGWCDCGQPAVESVETELGPFLLCQSCLELEKSE